jgi:hypothetical protein
MITKLIVTTLSAALVIGTASATFAAPKSKKQHAPREATVTTTAPQGDNPYYSQALHETRTTQPVREATIPEPSYFTAATGRDTD